jgi:hypothetical protein
MPSAAAAAEMLAPFATNSNIPAWFGVQPGLISIDNSAFGIDLFPRETLSNGVELLSVYHKAQKSPLSVATGGLNVLLE